MSVDLRVMMQHPNPADVQALRVGSLLLYETMDGMGLLHVEIMARPWYDVSKGGVVALFRREKMLLDYVVFEVPAAGFSLNVSPEDLEYVRRCVKALTMRYEKKIAALRPLLKMQLVVLQDVGMPKEFIGQVAEILPASVRYAWDNPQAKRRRKEREQKGKIHERGSDGMEGEEPVHR